MDSSPSLIPESKGSVEKRARNVINNYCSELVDYTRSYLQTDKFGLHFGLDYDLW